MFLARFVLRLLVRFVRHAQVLPCQCKIGSPYMTGGQAVMADAMKAGWQNMDQEAADELIGGERHAAVAVAPLSPVVFVAEGHAALIVGERDAMGIARQVLEHGRGPAIGSTWP